MDSSPPHLFCFGFGYCAQALARRLLARGWRVTGTGRDPGRWPMAEVAAVRFDRDHPVPVERLAQATHILSSIPPDDEGDPVLDRHRDDLARLAPAWVGYLSTTGVYGDRGGAPVTETDALTPTGERGRRRVAAETGWAALGLPLHRFRLAGIYGPGRSPLDSVRAGRAHRAVKPGQLFSRIHVEDVASVLAASIARPNPGAAYNLADDEPAPPQDVVLHACRLLGVEPPPEVPIAAAGLSPMALSFYQENKRVVNRRIKDELGVRLAYPTYREGLAALLTSSSS